MIVILHLSDVHISEHNNPITSRVEAVASSLRGQTTQVDACFIVVSGDIAFSGLSSEYSIAHCFLSSLRERIASDHSTAQVEFVVVPGNHDCNFQRLSDLRDLAIHHLPSSDALDVNGDIVRTCLSVQDEFFKFFESLTNQRQSITQRIFSECEYQIRGHTIRFCLYNTAWVSQLHESPGTLFFPITVAAESDSPSRPVDVAVSVLHHSLNWLEPANARSLRAHLERTSDFVLTGHEHVPGRVSRSSDTGGQITHIESAALQVREDKELSGFNVILLDLAGRRQLTTRYTWARTLYEERPRPTWINFARNPLLARQAFENSDYWSGVLEDPGTAFTHPRRDVIRLSDLFVYPDLSRRSIDPIIAKRARRVAGVKVLDFISSTGNVVITGPSNSGKTSLAKRLYLDLKQRKGVVPVFLNGSELYKARRGKFPQALITAFDKQYSPNQAGRYKQLEASQRVLIIDDFEQSRLSLKTQKEFVKVATQFAGSVVVFADDLFMIERLAHSAGNRNEELEAFEHCEIEEFGFRLRGDLIERWLGLGFETTEKPANFDHQIATTEKLVDTMLGKNLLPSYPLTILTILQTAEAAASPGTASGSYGYMYEALITSALASASKSFADVDTKYTYLAHLAYSYYHLDVTSGLSRETIDQISREYFSEFRISFSVEEMLSELMETHILTKMGGNYAFKYKYIYCYFVARYFRDSVARSREAREEIKRMSSRLHVEDYANILVFYLYLTRDVEVIEHVMSIATSVYSDHEPWRL